MSDLPQENAPLAELLEEVKRLNNHSYLVNNATIVRMIFYQILRGLAFGLGSVMGATILVSVVAYFLSGMDFIPVLGEWATQIAEEIKVNKQ